MSYEPSTLRDWRLYMQGKTGLPPQEVGTVGNQAHNGGYHCGWDRRFIARGQLADYSWIESPRDSSHTTDAASAGDIGNFPRLRELSNWLAKECASGAPDTLDIREFIYSPDGLTVVRWDRLGKRTTGDASHLTHSHVSWFRDAESRPKTQVFQRFFEGGNSMSEFSELDPWGVDPDGNHRTPAQQLRDLYAAVCYGSRPRDMQGVEVGPEMWIVETLTALQIPPVSIDYSQLAEALRPIVAEETEAAVRRVLGSLG